MINLEEAFATWPELLTREATGRMIGGDKPILPGTLANWETRGTFKKELPIVKIGRCVRYRKSDVIAFIKSRTKGGATEPENSKSWRAK